MIKLNKSNYKNELVYNTDTERKSINRNLVTFLVSKKNKSTQKYKLNRKSLICHPVDARRTTKWLN